MRTITATALTPLYLGGDPEAGDTTSGLDHVPGSVLRGALAARWIREHGIPDRVSDERRRQFRALFDGKVAFRALRPVGSVMVPVSVRRCKYDRACAGSVDLLHHPDRPTSGACPVCGGALDDGGKGTLAGGPTMANRTMVALTAAGTPADGALFSRVGLPRGTRLAGDIVALRPGAAPDEIGSWLDDLDGELLWLGGRRTAAGRVRIEINPSPQRSVTPREDDALALTLQSPAITVDDAGRPSLGFPVNQIETLLGVRFDPQRTRRWIRPARAGGWHAASGLPKPSEHALGAGSSILLHPQGAAPPLEALEALARSGIGLRRTEGFGDLTVNPLEWEAPMARDRGAPTADLSSTARDYVARLIAAVKADPSVDRDRDLAWILDLAKETALATEAGTQVIGASVAERPRLRHWRPETRDLLVELTSRGSRPEQRREDLTHLRAVVTLIAGALGRGEDDR